MVIYYNLKRHFSINLKIGSFALAIFLIFSPSSISSNPLQSDTVILTLKKADSIFLENNLQLLAQKCNVDAARAQVLQNQLWDNPTITVNQSAYNTEYNKNSASKWFPLSDNGETNVQVQQMITIAGKRNKRVKLAELTALKTEYIFYDLLRTLKYQLHSDFYKLYFTQLMLSVYTMEIGSIEMLISAFEGQYQQGHVSKKDLLRLKATLFSLENEKMVLDNQLIDTKADFAILLRLGNSFPMVKTDLTSLDSIKIERFNPGNLIDTAVRFRNDLKAAEIDLQYNKLYLDYQRALAIPDFQLIAGWDKNGSYVHNYNYLGIQIDLPIFNRNQGNIKSAIASAQNSQHNYKIAQDLVSSDVSSAYSKALQCDKLYKQLDKNFNSDFTSMQEEILKNYEKRNISLLEFLDFYDAYKQNAISYNTLQNNRVDAFEGVNYSVGKNIIVW